MKHKRTHICPGSDAASLLPTFASFAFSLRLFPSSKVYGLCYDVTPLAKGHFACRFAKLLTFARKLQQQQQRTQPNINTARTIGVPDCGRRLVWPSRCLCTSVALRGIWIRCAQLLEILPFLWLNGRSATVFGPFHCA